MEEWIDRPGAVRAGEGLDETRLAAFLRARFGDAGELEVRQYPSGHSNLTYAVRFGEREWVLRRPPFGSKVKSAHDMGREFRVLSKLHAVYAPAPEVVAFCEDEAVLGAPFYLMQAVEGVILRSRLPQGMELTAKTAEELSRSFVENLVRLHEVDYAAAGLGDLGRPQGYLERQVQGWTERYEGSKTHEYDQVERIAAWMKAHVPETKRVSLIHNDYKYDNLVLDAANLASVVGVLDWEMCTVGDSLADLGTALAYWVEAGDAGEMAWGPTAIAGSYTREQVVRAYAKRTGADVSGMPFYVVLARFKLAVIVQQIYFRFHQGLTKDERFRSMPATVEALLKQAWACAESGEV